MAMRYARMSDTYAMVIEYINYFFSIIFNVEMVIKMIGLGRKYFTQSSWNIFDF